MTGYGKAEAEWEHCRVSVEISSVNHRYFDLSFYSPPSYSKLEYQMRKLVAERVKRGKVRFHLRILGMQEPFTKLSFHEDNFKAYVDAMKRAARLCEQQLAPATLDGLLGAPGVMIPSVDSEQEEACFEALRTLSEKAVAGLVQMREREGTVLWEDLAARAERIEGWAAAISERAPAVKEGYRKRMRERVAEWRVEDHVSPERLQAELLLFCERSDITEELVRVRSHLGQFRSTLKEGGPMGRRLAFLCQELHREINTIGSKANDAEIGATVVLMKEELGKAREQIDNLE